MKQTFGMQASSVVPLSSNAELVLFKDTEGIMKCWNWYFTYFFYTHTVFNEDNLSNLPQLDIIDEILDLPTSKQI